MIGLKKVRYGILSTATIVPRFIEGIRESHAGEVVAIAGRKFEQAQKMANEFAIPRYYGSYQELYQDDDIDIIYIANYNGGHYDCLKEALQAGKNVLCEKPICMTKEQAEEVFTVAKEKGVFLMEAQKSVFLPAHQKVRQLLAQQDLGEIQWVNIISCHTGAERGEWFKKLANGGGILRGAGTYSLEFLLTAFQQPLENISGNFAIQPPMSDDGCVINLKMAPNIMVSILITKDIVTDSRIEIYGTTGRLTIPNFWKTDRLSLEKEGKEETLVFEMNSEFVFEIDHVNDCLQRGLLTSPIMTPAVSIEATTIIDELYRKNIGVTE